MAVINPIPNQLLATVNDFILAYGEIESIEISNPENVSQQTVNTARIENALSRAFSFVKGYEALAPIPGKAAIRFALKRLMLDIARYFLDTIKRRDDVIKSYEDCIRFLELAIKMKDSHQIPDDDLKDIGLDPFYQYIGTITAVRGRRAWSDETLEQYRKQKLFFP